MQKPRTTTTMELELPPKRARSGPMSLPAIGEDTTEWLEDRGLALRHGTSMRLMADVTQYLNDSTDFNEVDPNADWEKVAITIHMQYATLTAHRARSPCAVRRPPHSGPREGRRCRCISRRLPT